MAVAQVGQAQQPHLRVHGHARVVNTVVQVIVGADHRRIAVRLDRLGRAVRVQQARRHHARERRERHLADARALDGRQLVLGDRLQLRQREHLELLLRGDEHAVRRRAGPGQLQRHARIVEDGDADDGRPVLQLNGLGQLRGDHFPLFAGHLELRLWRNVKYEDGHAAGVGGRPQRRRGRVDVCDERLREGETTDQRVHAVVGRPRLHLPLDGPRLGDGRRLRGVAARRAALAQTPE